MCKLLSTTSVLSCRSLQARGRSMGLSKNPGGFMVGYGKKFRTGVAGFVIKVPSLSR
jgi:hypothetical protein